MLAALLGSKKVQPSVMVKPTELALEVLLTVLPLALVLVRS